MVTVYIKIEMPEGYINMKMILEIILSLFLVFSPMVFLIHYLQNADCKTITAF